MSGDQQEDEEEQEEVGASEAAEEEETEVDYEEEDEDDEEEASTAEYKTPDDENRMTLTDEERQWALEIKRAVEMDDELESLSDFWYAQLAIIDRGDVASSLERMGKLQCFREEYGIVEDGGGDDAAASQRGTKWVREFVRLLPEFWLALTFNQRDGNYVLVIDISKTHNRFGKSKQECLLARMRATYYMNHAMSPDFQAIREGPVILAENKGFDWKKNFGNTEFRRLWAELCAPYPYQFRQIKNFNTGVLFNLIVSMARPFLPPETHQRFQMGCQCQLGTLDKIYLIPTVTAANQRLLESTRQALERRYNNEATFVL